MRLNTQYSPPEFHMFQRYRFIDGTVKIVPVTESLMVVFAPMLDTVVENIVMSRRFYLFSSVKGTYSPEVMIYTTVSAEAGVLAAGYRCEQCKRTFFVGDTDDLKHYCEEQ